MCIKICIVDRSLYTQEKKNKISILCTNSYITNYYHKCLMMLTLPFYFTNLSNTVSSYKK